LNSSADARSVFGGTNLKVWSGSNVPPSSVTVVPGHALAPG
jgi:hypothetical protein